MTSYIITGATSMIGVAFIKQCIKQNIHVYALTRKNSSNLSRLPKSDLVTLVECNLDNLLSIDTKNINAECFIHFGWSFTDKTGRNDVNKQFLNIQYSIDAVHLAKKIGCKKFIGAGSQAEFGIADVPLNGDVSCNPLIPYGIAKYASGKFCKIECNKLGLEFNWVRILSIYGSNDIPGTLIKTLIQKMQGNEPMPLGPCTHIWDYLFEDDAGSAFLAIAQHGVNGKTYCLGSGNGHSLKEYIEIIRNFVNPSYEPEYEAIPYTKDSIQFLQADISELTADTGWKPKVGFEEGIKNILA